MKNRRNILFYATALVSLLVACGSLLGFKIAIDSDPPGAQIEVNGEYIGATPTTYTIRGNDDRSFNGSWVQQGEIVFTATPPHDQTNLYVQKKSFSPSAFFKQGDHIPERMRFDMHVNPETSHENLIHIDLNSK